VPFLALTRPVPPTITECELTHLAREPISFARAAEQHDAYEAALRALGCTVKRLPGAPQHPDSVFIEDTALVFHECAVITRPGAESRRGETEVVAHALEALRALLRINGPDTLDGGDVLRVGKRLWVGLSTRSTAGGAKQLGTLLKRFGYQVDTAVVRDCLHLKTAVSSLPDGRLLLNPRMVDAWAFDAQSPIEVDPTEPFAGNVLCVGDTVLCAASAPRTRALLDAQGYKTVAVDASELAKAEGGLTCCSLLVSDASA
jgi:dimethylargininase